MRRLAATSGVHVALISGRTVADLAVRTAIGGASYHGDHGAEWALASPTFDDGPLRVEREPALPSVEAMADRLKLEVPRRVDEPWLVLEDKGPALTLHFRAAPDIEAARARVTDAVERVDPERLLERFRGRRSLELRPAGAATKATTLDRLVRQHRPANVLMLGDDLHDRGAFDVLRDRRAAGHVDGLAVAVLGPAAEAHEIAGHADVVLASPDAVADFLDLVAGALGRAS